MKNNNSSFNDSQDEASIDLKPLLYKIVGYWRLFVVTSIIALSIAKFKNGYEEMVLNL